jgi:hypothetical protein
MQNRWFDDHDEVVYFATILLDSGQLPDDTREVVYYFDRPYKWDKEHDIWESHDRPVPHLDIVAEEWETYCNNTDAWMSH